MNMNTDITMAVTVISGGARLLTSVQPISMSYNKGVRVPRNKNPMIHARGPCQCQGWLHLPSRAVQLQTPCVCLLCQEFEQFSEKGSAGFLGFI